MSDIENFETVVGYQPREVVPGNGRTGTWVGRCWVPAEQAVNGVAGPRVVTLLDGKVCDASALFPTMSALANAGNPVEQLYAAENLPVLAQLETVLENSVFSKREKDLGSEKNVTLLAPNDLLATKACGVTFAKSLLERVVEEKAKGDPKQAEVIRGAIIDALGEDISGVKPGSPATAALKTRLIKEGIWSQYLEVGIGPDAEVFTKAQPMATVGFGAQIGVLPDSAWNNPEPEIVLLVSRRGEILGAALGNDVNLRDYEGRSALLLGEAKDQNGSCAIGPFMRLFDDQFTLSDIERCEVELAIFGQEDFETCGRNRMAEISRSPQELVAQVISDNHQYPDGLVLFLGTMFAPTEDRDNPGEGFTHRIGDRVEVASEELGRLVNWVNYTNTIPPWDYGTSDLIEYLIESRATGTTA